jgi:hypothetical protein
LADIGKFDVDSLSYFLQEQNSKAAQARQMQQARYARLLAMLEEPKSKG